MAVNYSNAVKHNRMVQVIDAIDAGSSYGKLKIFTTAYGTLLAALTFSKPCATDTNGTLTFASMPKTVAAAAAGTAAIAQITDSDDTVIANGLTVGTGGTDIVIDNTNIAAGQTVNLTSAVITHG